MSITYEDWMNLTKKRFYKRSSALKDVDKWFELYDQHPDNSTYLDNLAKAFKTWRDTKTREDEPGGGVAMPRAPLLDTIRNRNKDENGLGPVDRLAVLLRQAKVSNVGIRKTVTPIDDRVVIDGNTFTTHELVRIEEATRRITKAVRDARDAVVRANRVGANRDRYEMWFGIFDQSNYNEVKKNFMRLDKVCSNGGLIFMDGRSDPTYGQVFAWTFRGNHEVFVNMWLGTAFFSGVGSYEVSSDATVVTLVHEMSHACFMASDVPTVASGQALDGNGNPPGGAAVCNDAAEDQNLAVHDPDSAIRNADNYGQFAWAVLQELGG
jgi:hypothetical protein